MAELNVKTQNGSYNILIENGALKKAGEFFNLKRKVLIDVNCKKIKKMIP